MIALHTVSDARGKSKSLDLAFLNSPVALITSSLSEQSRPLGKPGLLASWLCVRALQPNREISLSLTLPPAPAPQDQYKL